jgi:hypothetical protein
MKWIIRALLEKGGLIVKLTIYLYVGLKTRRVVALYPVAAFIHSVLAYISVS